MNKKIFIKTFGCQMNKSDSTRLREKFLFLGYSMTENKDMADVLIYNTCSVRAHAENRAMSHLGRLKFLKRKNEEVKICVVGCMAQRMKKEITTRLPHVDFVVGPSKMMELPETLENKKKGIFFDRKDTSKRFPSVIKDFVKTDDSASGYVPVMKGCNNYCAYCIVPYVRGREQYRPVKDIINDCENLSGKGIKEILLLGQTVNSHPNFKQILKRVSRIDGLSEVKFVTSYPGYMNKETVDLVIENKVLSNYFHLPIQSGSNKVLKKMNRKYSVEHYLDITRYIRHRAPDAGISTDIIVGFPGEDEDDFKKTLSVVEEIEFDQCFTFKYSPRPNTKASSMNDDVDDKTKKKRLAKLNRICGKYSFKRNKRMEGKKVKVLAKEHNSGRTESNKIVFWEGKKAGPDDEVKVVVTRGLAHSLKGDRIE
ncbi:MAG: tRNA (N6-isopentenyl adenosine(37)-C2)-methylthiotransferase MiaB [Elusimicrobiota bacterium]